MLVEEPQGEDSCGSEVKRVEFKVMSPLLASWSVGFDRMISSGEFIEAQMVITDFSSTAVELFLRFLYSGVVKGPLETLVEVCALADKYQVQGLNPGNACQLFAFAARYQLADLLRMVLEEIWINPDFCQHNPEPLRLQGPHSRRCPGNFPLTNYMPANLSSFLGMNAFTFHGM